MRNVLFESYYAVMALVQIRDVSEQTRRELKARAAGQGQSLNTYLRELLDREVARPTVADVLQRAELRAERSDTSVVEMLAAGRADRENQLLGGLDR